jgi:hypothetical protein
VTNRFADTHRRESQKRDSNHVHEALDLSIRPARDARIELRRQTSIVFKRDRVIFVRRHFLRAFSSRDDIARDTRPDSGFIFHTQDRTTSCAICRRRF